MSIVAEKPQKMQVRTAGTAVRTVSDTVTDEGILSNSLPMSTARAIALVQALTPLRAVHVQAINFITGKNGQQAIVSYRREPDLGIGNTDGFRPLD